SPEACAAILWKDAAKSGEAAEALKITAKSLKSLGLIDHIIKEPAGGAHKNPQMAAELLKKAILENYEELKKLSTEDLINERYMKFRQMGEFSNSEIKVMSKNLIKEEAE
ncbi:MAG: acetyl-CoA carboxylase carboxyl transferase subunit alpha, partial [Bacillota bacterium]